jgi:hypothetical protein
VSFLYRDHRGGYVESMATLQMFDNLDDLSAYLTKSINEIYLGVELETIQFERLSHDARNGWDTHLVIGKVKHLSGIPGNVIFGMVDKPVSVSSYTVKTEKKQEVVKLDDIMQIFRDTLFVEDGRHPRVGGTDAAAEKIRDYVVSSVASDSTGQSEDSRALKTMRKVDTDSALDHLLDGLFADDHEAFKQLGQDREKLISVFVGLAMKVLHGAADPSVIKRKIEERLQKGEQRE